MVGKHLAHRGHGRAALLAARVALAVAVAVLAGLAGLPGRGAAAPEATVGLRWSTTLPGGRVEDSSPTLADITGNGKLEVIIGTTALGGSPYLVVLRHDGSILWSRQLADPMYSAATVAEISSAHAGPEIIISTGGAVSPPNRGSVIAFSAAGAQLWKYDTNDAQNTGTPNGNWASPVVGDVDGDGDMEIVIGSWDRNIYLLNHLGQKMWHYHVGDTVWSTPVLVDLNGNGNLEIVVGTDISGGGILPDGYHTIDGGFVLILNKGGQKLARRQMDETIFSSPAVADVNGDGKYEIFVGSGHYFNQANCAPNALTSCQPSPKVHGFSVNTSGAQWTLDYLPGWPVNVARAGMSSPALADLNGDGQLEIIIGSGYTGMSNAASACTDSASDPNCRGALYAFRLNGEVMPGFPAWPIDSQGLHGFIRSSPTVADVDGDGQNEILFGMNWDVVILGSNGVKKHSLRTYYSVFGSPAIGDLDGDGRTNIVIGSSDIRAGNGGTRGVVWNFTFDTGTYNPAMQPWPSFHRDARNSGLVALGPRLSVTPGEAFVMHQLGQPGTVETAFIIRNTGGGSFDWTASATGNLSLPVRSGSVATATTLRVNVAIPTSQITGTIEAGSVTVRASGVPGSPATVTVDLYLGNIYRTFFPYLRR